MTQPGMQSATFGNAAFQRVENPKPRREVAPIGVLGWKIRFIATAVVMFLAYAAVSPVLDRMGWRLPCSVVTGDPDAGRDCYAAGMSIEDRASCMVARDDARERERKARRDKENADATRRRAEQKALDDEIARQRQAGKRMPLAGGK